MPIIDQAFLDALALERESVVTEASEEQDAAFGKIARLAASRERCESELRARLARDGFSPRDAQAALERAVSCGLVDDIRYADVLIRSRISQGKGRAGIEDELARAGVRTADVPGWPDEYFPASGPSEENRAYEVLLRKPPRSSNPYAAACRKLASRGFSAEVAFSAARRFVGRGDEVF